MLTKESYGEWLNQFDWDLWTTLTFRNVPTANTAMKHYLRMWSNLRHQKIHNAYSWAGTEEGKLYGRIHLHTLIGDNNGRADHIKIWLNEYWKKLVGRPRVLWYDKSQGAAFYVAKYVTKEIGQWEAIGHWPRPSKAPSVPR